MAALAVVYLKYAEDELVPQTSQAHRIQQAIGVSTYSHIPPPTPGPLQSDRNTLVLSWTNQDPRESLLFNSWGVLYRFQACTSRAPESYPKRYLDRRTLAKAGRVLRRSGARLV